MRHEKEMNEFCVQAREALLRGGIAVIPTDTLYGIVAQAEDVQAVELVYKMRARDPKKPVIVLIAKKSDLKIFNISLSPAQNKFLNQVWPGKVSVILPCADKKFLHVHRGGGTIAFRVPDHDALRALLKKTGPLIAPSANPEGMPPAKTIAEARAYFGDSVDVYCDGGTLAGPPSSIISLVETEPRILRP